MKPAKFRFMYNNKIIRCCEELLISSYYLNDILVSIFSDKFESMVNRNAVGSFFKDKNMVDEKLNGFLAKWKKLNDDNNSSLQSEIPLESYITKIQNDISCEFTEYPVLVSLFSPLFNALKSYCDQFIWGGINYWDEFAQHYYTEQWTNFTNNNAEKIFFQVMNKWVKTVNENDDHIIPLTSLLFAKQRKRIPIIFAKDKLKDEVVTIPDICYLQDEANVIILIKLKDYSRLEKDEIKKAINSNSLNQDFGQIQIIEQLKQFIKTIKKEDYPSDLLNSLEQGLKKLGGTPINGKQLYKLINLFLIFDIISPNEGKYIGYYPACIIEDIPVGGILLYLNDVLDRVTFRNMINILTKNLTYPGYIIR